MLQSGRLQQEVTNVFYVSQSVLSTPTSRLSETGSISERPRIGGSRKKHQFKTFLLR